MQLLPATLVRRPSKKAFSVIEILIVIALFSLATTLVVFNFEGLIRSYTEKSIEGLFDEALRKARFEAIATQTPMHLWYDAESSTLKIDDALTTIASYPTQLSKETTSVEFFPRLPSDSLSDARSFKAGDVPLPYLLCTPQGITPPVKVVLKDSAGTYIQWLDPFSSGTLSPK